jgi:hypothetical protein
VTAPHEQLARLLDLDASGRPLNPDTNLPYPSVSAAQEQLSENVLARLLDALPHLSHAEGEVIRGALVEVAVRQHGRTTRAHLADLREQAEALDADARNLARDGIEGAVIGRNLRLAACRAAAANTLRGANLLGYRA